MTFQRVQRELTAGEIARLHELRAGGKRLKELAHEFGISHQTVSRYLRGPAEASPATKPPVPELPAWPLGAAGGLHRRDLYDE